MELSLYSLNYLFVYLNQNGIRNPCKIVLTQDIEMGKEDETALNEELVDRLRILNYERDYVGK